MSLAKCLSKRGSIVGAGIGLVICLYAILFLEKFHHKPLEVIIAMEGFGTFLFTVCLPWLLSAVIAGSLVETLFIRKTTKPSNFFSRYKVGSIMGCLAGGVLSSSLLLSLGLIGGVMVGGFVEILFGPRFTLSGMFIGVFLASVILILTGSFVGMLVGAICEKLIRCWCGSFRTTA